MLRNVSVHSEHERDARRRPAVMADVAKLAGVSHQTVSRVLNNSERVRDETRERVLSAMRMLDYRPNSVARALVTGRSRTLGVVSFDTTLYGPASTLLGIERAAHEAGYFVSILSLRQPDRTSVLSAVERLRVQGVEGILIIAPQQAGAQALMHLPSDLPIVSAEAGPENTLPLAMVDQYAGAAAATRHLLELGHGTVWHVAGPPDWLEAEQRVAGWRSTLQDAGAAIHAPLEGDWSPRAGYEAGARLLRVPDVTAVFVANDQMALGLLRSVHEAGRQVPREISVVGFDDVPEAAYFLPPLTTIRQDFAEMGRRSLHLLLGEIESGTRSSRRETITPEIVLRQSTAPPPAAATH
jgi:DNA-binding LacI/PurR family transcriptional regulator